MSLTKKEAIEQLWELGELSWKLIGKQHEVYSQIMGQVNSPIIVLCSRRFGKTFTLMIICIEYCLKNPNSIVKYAMPEQKQVKRAIRPIMRTILQDCPKHMLPDYNENDKIYRFSNGSEIHMAGTDNGNAEGLRGGHANLCIIDEAGFCTDLDYIVDNIMSPMTDTVDGRIVMISTPNYKNPAHEFHTRFVFPAEGTNRIVKFTLFDSPTTSDAQKAKIIARYPGGVNHPKFKCEYMVEIPRVSETTVIPEFQDVKTESISDDYKLPIFFDSYVSADIGFRDLTVVLFAYYDFKKACLVIRDELVMNGPEMTTLKLANEILEKEKELFTDADGNLNKPYMRIMDNDLKLINDLSVLHNINFIPTKKDNKEAQINNLRIWIANNKIIIDPKCKHLIYHLDNAQWNKTRTDFLRIEDRADGYVRGGHADALDALIYLVRNIQESKNPYPVGFGVNRSSNRFHSLQTDNNISSIAKEFASKLIKFNNKK
jgi:hypothetical protein